MYKVNIKNEAKFAETNGAYGEWGGLFKTEAQAQEYLTRALEKLSVEYSTKEVSTNEEGEEIVTIIPGVFLTEVVDLSLDPEETKKEIREKRRKEYPTELELLEALIEDKEGSPEKLASVISKRAAIKIKYPIEGSANKKK